MQQLRQTASVIFCAHGAGVASPILDGPLTELWRAMKNTEIGEDGILRLPPTELLGLELYNGKVCHAAPAPCKQ